MGREAEPTPAPLPLGRSSKYARRAIWLCALYCLCLVGSLSLIGASAEGLLGNLEPCAILAFLYFSAVFAEQTWSLHFHRGDHGYYGLAVGAFAVLLSPLLIGSALSVWDVRIGAMGLSAVIYWYIVRGPSYQLPGATMGGKVCLVTGCNVGIGLATAQALACAGARVIFACRSEEKAREAMKQVLKGGKGVVKEDQLIFIAPLDLGSLQSVRDFATKFRLVASMKDFNLHVLVLNAGALFATRALSADGVEMTFATNHLGHFLLAHHMLPHLRGGEKSFSDFVPRVVVVGSTLAFGYNAYDFAEAVAVGKDGPAPEEFLSRPYASFHAYGQSKLANLLFARELGRRLREGGSRVAVSYVHPGSVLTEFPVNIKWAYPIYKVLRPVGPAFLKTTQQGSVNPVFAAAAPSVAAAAGSSGGAVYIDRLAFGRTSEAGEDPVAAKRLWTTCERLCSLPVT